MEEKSISQVKLAEFLGVKQPTISKYVRGIREPDFEILIKIADFFEVSVDYLIGRKDY